MCVVRFDVFSIPPSQHLYDQDFGRQVSSLKMFDLKQTESDLIQPEFTAIDLYSRFWKCFGGPCGPLQEGMTHMNPS